MVNAKEHDDEKPSCPARKLRCKRGHLSITQISELAMDFDDDVGSK
jgi:hypothetical protein